MADLDLLSIQPHQVSRNLRGYSVFFYGEPKSGKTTTATKFPNHLLFAFDDYNIVSSVEKTETICSKKNYEKRQNKQ